MILGADDVVHAPPRAIVFDLWFTLISPEDHRDPGVSTYTEIPKVLGLDPAPFDAFWRARTAQHNRESRPLRDHVEEYLSGLGRSMTDEEDAAFDDVWAAHDKALASPRATVVATLAGLAGDGVQLGLLSNAHEREIRTWSSSPLAEHIRAACFSCHTGHVKPEPEAFEQVLGLLEAPAERAIFVGDGASGELLGAREVGFGRTIFMRGFLAEDGVSDQVVGELADQADAVIDRIEDLRALLASDALGVDD